VPAAYDASLVRRTGEQEVSAGDFATADEAIRQAIVSQHERLELRRSVLNADAAIECGEFVTPKTSCARIEELTRKYTGR
jgi:Arc/MetJ-type ribon-helix-helix transcriptional regulator